MVLSDEQMMRVELIVEFAECRGFVHRPETPEAAGKNVKRWAKWIAELSRRAILSREIRRLVLVERCLR